jgi:GH18 family chitinase
VWCFAYLAIVLIAAAGNAQVEPKPAAEPPTFRIAGYLPDYRAAEFDPATAKPLTDLILFSAEPTAAGPLDLSRLKKMPWADLRAFKTKQRVRLILCVGGWERSKHFAAAAGSEKTRAEFVKSAVGVCLDERLDGLDLDWEHPKSAAEQSDYAALLADLRAGFQPHGLALSVTMAGWQKLPHAGFAAVDWVNLMAYDHPDRHSTFEAAQADVKRLLDAGAKAEQITLGIPLYGRDRDKPERAVSYRELLAKNKLDADADEVGRVFFNGPATVRRKTEYAAEANLAGVMVWELGQDATGESSLVRVIQAASTIGRK